MKRTRVRIGCCLLIPTWIAALFAPAAAEDGRPARESRSLNGEWLFQRDGAAEGEWKTVDVPSSFESHEGPEFNGVGWYRRTLEPFAIPDGKRGLLHFQAAATEATVFFDGQKIGAHLGGWTPFRFDVTDLVRKAPDRPHEIRVRLDEKVGHNTQGFLPIIAPHFGGIWQSVELLIVPETYVDDLSLLAYGDTKARRIVLEIPFAGTEPASPISLVLRHRLRGRAAWQSGTRSYRQTRVEFRLPPGEGKASEGPVISLNDLGALDIAMEGNTVKTSIAVAEPRLWSPEAPNLYELEIELAPEGPGRDLVRTRAAFRTFEVFGDQLRLNGRPLCVRGLLNWGYYPPLTAPAPGEETFRWDIEFARSRGFNLVKFCLWLPPKRYLELADEVGLLAWMEYPTWHPQLTKEHIEALRKEFTEFFLYDRNHPSAILRSLTCETGAGADLEVIRDLYDRAHAAIPGAVVEDDSSWIGWNRVHDFYDDHPYGNNHTWVPVLRGFKDYILAHGAKPLLLGEAIAADTWVEREPLASLVGNARPFQVPGFFDEAARWKERARALWGPEGLGELVEESMRYAQLMRKYQVEAYRREIPYGGYVLSVIRDFSLASMGFVDYLGHPKWTQADWEWHRDTICLLATEGDRRSFFSGEKLRADLLVSHFSPTTLRDADLSIELENTEPEPHSLAQASREDVWQNPGTLAKALSIDFALPEVTLPIRLVIRAVLGSPDGQFRNEWPIWVVPRPEPSVVGRVALHPSVTADLAAELFPGAPRLEAAPAGIVVTTRFDDRIVGLLEAGAAVLLLPDGQKDSLPLSAHWFLRGGPYVSGHPLTRTVPRDLLVELQHFDLAGDVIPEIRYLDAIDPLLLLWDTHDLKTVKTHGLIYEARAGKGRLLVSAVRHGSPGNAAGRWLLWALLRHIESGPLPSKSFPDAMWLHVKEKLHEETIALVDLTWRFKPEPPGADVAAEWASPAAKIDESWKEIRIGSAWESQGYPSLDGWAWYRLSLKIPGEWKGRRTYLSFEGVDDMYELYVGGTLVARCGDPAARKDTFSERRSHDITDRVKPGEECVIAVRVHDWHGAGGIFRPVTAGTAAFADGYELLK